MKRLLLAAALGLMASSVISAEPEPDMICNTSVMVAHKAYIEGTYDAKNPDVEQLHYLVEYWADMSLVRSDRELSKAAVEYIADHMQATGARMVDPNLAYMFAREFMVKGCK